MDPDRFITVTLLSSDWEAIMKDASQLERAGWTPSGAWKHLEMQLEDNS
jgi:hypothetical protein